MYLENYGVYRELIENGYMKINISEINKSNYNDHYNWILNIVKDAIETDIVRNKYINITFANGLNADLAIPDYWINLIMWYSFIALDSPVHSKYLLFLQNLRINDLKAYIDKFIVNLFRKQLTNIQMNNIIDDFVSKFVDIDIFSYYLANTIDLYDFVDLMNRNEEFNNLIHADLSDVPVEDVKKVGLELTERSVELIMQDNDHCLANFFRAKEGVSKKQYKEVFINIGTKPDGKGGVFPISINNNFVTGGVSDLVSYIIESSVGRTAQIIVNTNVGDSGYFARLLGLNNTDTFLNPNPSYVCDSKNFQIIEIKNEQVLSRFKNRYYRFSPKGIEYILDENDYSLIGKTIYLRSPMTCVSASEGHGVCHRCYGELAHTNSDLNIGKLAAEMLSSVITQKMLSAKHLLESAVIKLKWVENFETYFSIDFNTIKLIDSFQDQFKGYKISINPDDINQSSEEEDDEDMYNEYIEEFSLITPKGRAIPIHTENMDNLYLTTFLNSSIRKKGYPVDNNIIIDCEELIDMPLFAVQLHNNDLSVMLDKVQGIINKAKTVKTQTRISILQLLIDTLIETGLEIDSVHTEIILMNQLRNVDNILETPDWKYPDEPCKILTLKQALSNHPSVTTGLVYENINSMLYNPLTYKKNKPSYMDLFFMEKPQEFLNAKGEYCVRSNDTQEEHHEKNFNPFNRNIDK